MDIVQVFCEIRGYYFYTRAHLIPISVPINEVSGSVPVTFLEIYRAGVNLLSAAVYIARSCDVGQENDFR